MNIILRTQALLKRNALLHGIALCVIAAIAACEGTQPDGTATEATEPGVAPQPEQDTAQAAPAEVAPTAAPTQVVPPNEVVAEPSAKPADPSAMTPKPAIENASKPATREKTEAAATADKPSQAAPTPAPKPSAELAACGDEGQPMCPLQAFMEQNVQKPLEAKDFAAVAKSLTRVAKLAPDAAWNSATPSWPSFAEDGIAAAKSGDEAALKQTCKGCHKAFRSKYKATFRTRPLP